MVLICLIVPATLSDRTNYDWKLQLHREEVDSQLQTELVIKKIPICYCGNGVLHWVAKQGFIRALSAFDDLSRGLLEKSGET